MANALFPVFLKLNELHTLLIGAGEVGLEKLRALIVNSPDVRVKVIAEQISPDFQQYADNFANVTICCKSFEACDLREIRIVIAATNNDQLNRNIRTLAHEQNLLVNIADKPSLCDFYLGSVVKKGDLKIAISTNGKSPTVAKRLKELLQVSIPDEIDTTLQQLNSIRDKLKGNLKEKIITLNKITEPLVQHHQIVPVKRKISSKTTDFLRISMSFLAGVLSVLIVRSKRP